MTSTGTVKRQPSVFFLTGSCELGEWSAHALTQLCSVPCCPPLALPVPRGWATLLPLLLIFIDIALPAGGLRALDCTDAVEPGDRELAGTGCPCRGQSELRLVAETVRAPPFFLGAPAGVGKLVALRSKMLLEQKTQPATRRHAATARSRAHTDAFVTVPVWCAWASKEMMLELTGATGLPSRLSASAALSAAVHAATCTAFSDVSRKAAA
mmetsp:Transcript_16688/g.47318  ORF Transcript_16688/g.47318 Transcript_16688/m.47318 type:complete len:211 (-) Transcript_16688:243-875(-)